MSRGHLQDQNGVWLSHGRLINTYKTGVRCSMMLQISLSSLCVLSDFEKRLTYIDTRWLDLSQTTELVLVRSSDFREEELWRIEAFVKVVREVTRISLLSLKEWCPGDPPHRPPLVAWRLWCFVSVCTSGQIHKGKHTDKPAPGLSCSNCCSCGCLVLVCVWVWICVCVCLRQCIEQFQPLRSHV